MIYFKVPTDDRSADDGELEKEQAAHTIMRQRSPRQIIAALISAISLSLILYFLFSRGRDRHSKIASCGSSSTEALSLGCRFDPMSFAWLPAPCFDQALTEEFLALRPWQWFLDTEGVAVNTGSVVAGEYSQLFVTQEYHMYHCTYMWKKMHRAILKEQPLDGYIGNMMHTKHCEAMLIDRDSALNETNTMILTKFVDCPKSQRDLVNAGWYRMVNGVRTKQSFEHHLHSSAEHI